MAGRRFSLNNVKIKHRISFLAIATIVGMLVFSGFLLVEKRQISTEMESLGRLAELGPAISALVHGLSKERGMSADLVSSKGRAFTDTLPRQSKLTSVLPLKFIR